MKNRLFLNPGNIIDHTSGPCLRRFGNTLVKETHGKRKQEENKENSIISNGFFFFSFFLLFSFEIHFFFFLSSQRQSTAIFHFKFP